MTTYDEIRAQARRAELPVPLCLRGDLVGRHAELEQRLQAAPLRATSMGERSPASIIAEEIRALEDEIQKASHTFWLRALPPREWSDFHATFPKKDKEETDEAFADRCFQWFCQLVSRCAFDPEMTPEQVSDLVPDLSGPQWNELANGAYSLNYKSVVVPFSLAASALTPSDEPNSKPQ